MSVSFDARAPCLPMRRMCSGSSSPPAVAQTHIRTRARAHTHTHTLHVDVCMHCRSGGQRQRICVDLQKHSARRLTIPRTCGRERKMARRIARGRNQRRCPHARREKRPLPRPLLRDVLTAPAQPEVPARRSRCWAARMRSGRDRRQHDRQQPHGQHAPQPQAWATHPHHLLHALAHALLPRLPPDP